MLVNALRAHLAEFGIVGAQGIHRVGDLVAIVADEGNERVPAIARGVLRIVADQIAVLQTGIADIDGRILAWTDRAKSACGSPECLASDRSSPRRSPRAYPMRRCSTPAENSPPGWAWNP